MVNRELFENYLKSELVYYIKHKTDSVRATVKAKVFAFFVTESRKNKFGDGTNLNQEQILDELNSLKCDSIERLNLSQEYNQSLLTEFDEYLNNALIILKDKICSNYFHYDKSKVRKTVVYKTNNMSLDNLREFLVREINNINSHELKAISEFNGYLNLFLESSTKKDLYKELINEIDGRLGRNSDSKKAVTLSISEDLDEVDDFITKESETPIFDFYTRLKLQGKKLDLKTIPFEHFKKMWYDEGKVDYMIADLFDVKASSVLYRRNKLGIKWDACVRMELAESMGVRSMEDVEKVRRGEIRVPDLHEIPTMLREERKPIRIKVKVK